MRERLTAPKKISRKKNDPPGNPGVARGRIYRLHRGKARKTNKRRNDDYSSSIGQHEKARSGVLACLLRRGRTDTSLVRSAYEYRARERTTPTQHGTACSYCYDNNALIKHERTIHRGCDNLWGLLLLFVYIVANHTYAGHNKNSGK